MLIKTLWKKFLQKLDSFFLAEPDWESIVEWREKLSEEELERIRELLDELDD